ncbi:MAG TPA: translation initiation factor IF-3 [Saprospiraceae bacterium]|nr:translation initiation factor IF-3 [Saprospiraceae bacterium]HMX83573.1 translation initiation factor IF-3 [Saprospiraceae bacterium]HMX85528.1 translation initiation factor IF-3 [Saprospiraceae bacterium]HMZ72440.1 translation initiation factor IF-3 [Saprospiraceae bacterium]HNA94895.1 translation initiation factor IF-3 [Saprospiraceae bacterium]
MAKKIKEQDLLSQKFNINERIRAFEVRLVGDKLDAISQAAGRKVELGVYPLHQLIKWAEEMELDVVEISPNANPPVVKITDFQKFLYDKKKREKEIKANTSKTVIKEIRFGPNTDEHDFEFKVRHAKKFLEEGSKVKAYVTFRGRSIVFQDRGELLLLKFLKELEEVGSSEALPKLEGRKMMVMLSPKKTVKKA